MFYPLPEASLGVRLVSRAGVLSYRSAEHLRASQRLKHPKAFFATQPDVLLINEGGTVLEYGFF